MLEQLRNSPFIVNYRRMWPFVKPYWFRALLAMLMCFPIGSMDAVIAWFLKPYMDMVLIEKTAGSSPWFAPLFIVGFTVLQGGMTYLVTYLNVWVGTHITQDLKTALYDKLLSFETSFFDTRNSGDIMYRFHNDADVACTGLLSNLRLFISRIFSSLSLIGILFYNSWKLSLIAIIVLGCTFYPMTRVRNLIRSIVKKTIASGSQTMTVYNETFAGNRTITAYNFQPQQRQKFRDIMKSLFKLNIKMTQRSSWLSPMMHITASIGIAATIGYGSHLILTNQLTPGGFVSFIAALLMLYTPIKNLGNNFTSVQVSFMAIERVFEILDTTPAIHDKKDAIELKAVRDTIEFRNVNFSYRPDIPILKNINLKVNAGQSIALVGNSGGGKSTIVSLIPRFYDIDSGNIFIDGVDIRDLTLTSLRDQIAVVFQDNFLFAGTIRENVSMGKPDATEKEIRNALDMAYLTDFIDSLENGLDTYIGERGILLSGGQKQRVAIARAFIKNAPIIILDEATSALDNKSEAVVQKAIDNLMRNRTVFVIAHRLSTIRNADKIVVINQGEIIETGSHNELMEIENGAYKSLYNAQFKNSAKKDDTASSENMTPNA